MTRAAISRKAKAMFLFGLFDREVRRAFRNYVRAAVRNPAFLFRRVHAQSIILLQPVDVLPSGEMDLCDGCPNKTYWQGRMISSCSLESYLKHGAPLVALPRGDERARDI